MNNGNALISDFGISKQLNDSIATSSSGIKGLLAYIDPCYIRKTVKLKRDKKSNIKSDIYSLGMLFWELASGVPPFSGFSNIDILIKIVHGEREKSIDNTPKDYADLYEECSSFNPDQRITIDEIINKLKGLSSEINIEYIESHINKTAFVDNIDQSTDQESIISSHHENSIPEDSISSDSISLHIESFISSDTVSISSYPKKSVITDSRIKNDVSIFFSKFYLTI